MRIFYLEMLSSSKIPILNTITISLIKLLISIIASRLDRPDRKKYLETWKNLSKYG